jgi:hypothetical protein
MYFDTSVLSNLLSIDILWKLICWIYRKIKGEPLKSTSGVDYKIKMYMVIK